MSYIVKVPHYQNHEKIIFEGPFDLLLKLIEEEKLDITEISLAKATDQFFDYLKTNLDIPPENLANFLVVAATLILIKSHVLLPALQLTPEEKEGIQDLEKRLAEYKKFKDISEELKKMFSEGQKSFARQSYIGLEITFTPPKKLALTDLESLFNEVIGEIPNVEKLAQAQIKEVITLSQKIAEFKANLEHRIHFTFQSMTQKADSKAEIIVSFLAVLELVRQQFIVVEQEEIFGEIRIIKSIKRGNI